MTARKLPAILVLAATTLLLVNVPRTLAQDTSPKAILTGHITNAATNAPIAGANVYAYEICEAAPTDDASAKPCYGGGGSAVTDENGKFSLTVPPGKVSLSVNARGFNGLSQQEFDTSHGSATADLALKPYPPASAHLVGTVVDAKGEPVPGALVNINPNQYYLMQTPSPNSPPTDLNGTATDPAGSSGSGTSSSGSAGAPDSFRKPDYEYDSYNQTTTDKFGRFDFWAYPGGHQLNVQAKGFAYENQDIVLAKGENSVKIQMFKVPASDAVLRGTVRDAQTGAPVPGVQVSVNSLPWGRYNWTTTGKDGTFTIRTTPGYAQITLTAWHYSKSVVATDATTAAGDVTTSTVAVDATPPSDGKYAPGSMPIRCCFPPEPALEPPRSYYTWVDSIELKSGDNAFSAKLVPKPEPTIAIVGYVVDSETHKAIPGAWVNVRNEDTGEYGSGVTDADGSFKFLVRPGWIVLDANAEKHFGRSASFAVAGAAPVRHDLVLPEGQTRYAPCDECGGPIMYEKGAMPSAAPSGITAQTQDSHQPSGGGSSGVTLRSTATAGADAPPSNSAQGPAYAGSAGGLGPYDGKTVESAPIDAAHTSAVPGVGLIGAIAALAVASVVLAARRR